MHSAKAVCNNRTGLCPKKYKIGIDQDVYKTLFLWHEGEKIATSMKKGNLEQQVTALN